MTVYIYSTLAADMAYTIYKPEVSQNDNISIIDRTVYVKGGSGVVAAKSTEGNFYTPKGVMTSVSEEEFELLLQNKVFQMHVDNGHVSYENKEKKVADVVKDLEEKEPSSPLTPDDFVTTEDGKNKLKPRKGQM